MSVSRSTSARRAGFTLIELLAVIVILSLLTWFLIANLADAARVVDVQVTKVNGMKLSGYIQELLDDRGDYPPSSLPNELGTPPNASNLGIECLYLALCADNAPADGKLDEMLSNTDDDRLAKNPPGFAVPTLFELKDQWDNPFAYFHHRDYGRVDTYVTIDPKSGERIDSQVSAYRNKKTGKYYKGREYQLISAGPDGNFETLDDNVTIGFDAQGDARADEDAAPAKKQ